MWRTVAHMNTPGPQSVAQGVSLAIKAGGYSIKAIAEQTHIPRVTLTRRLSGTTPFNVAELEAIAAVLGCSPTDFYKDAA